PSRERLPRRLVHAALGDELDDRVELVRVEPDPVLAAEVDEHARALAEVLPEHPLLADEAVEVAGRVRGALGAGRRGRARTRGGAREAPGVALLDELVEGL